MFKFSPWKTDSATDRNRGKGKLRVDHANSIASTSDTTSDSSNHWHADSSDLENALRTGPSHVAWINNSPPFLIPPLGAQMIGRSVSSPQPALVSSTTSKLYTHSTLRSTHSLRLDPRYTPGPDDGHFPIIKPLSPIEEQDYFSPETQSMSLPLVEQDITTSQASTPDGSQHSEIART